MWIAVPGNLAWMPSLAQTDLNTGFVRAVLEGMAPGRAWVDSLPAARAAHVVHNYGMSFVWGEHLGDVADSLAEHLRCGACRTRDEWLQIDPRWSDLPWDRLLDAAPGDPARLPGGARVRRYTRANFRFDASRFVAQNPDGPRLPAGWQLRLMTPREFDLPGVSVTPAAFWRTAAQFLAQGGGWCVERDREVGAMAFTSFRLDDTLEIGIETLPAHRGRGLARAAAAMLIQQLLPANITPVWSCRRENEASYQLACRLGFCPTLTVPYYWLPKIADAR